MTNDQAISLPTITFTIDRLPTVEEGYPVRRTESITMHVSPEDAVSPEHIETAARDAELMAQLLREKPHEMREFYNHVVAGRSADANRTARSIGLTEFDFKRQGGGMWPYILGVGVVIMGYAMFTSDGGAPSTTDDGELPHSSTESS